MTEKLRLLLITHDLEIGGLQKVVVSICKAIDREKFIPQVLCMRRLGTFAPEIEAMGIKVELLPQTKSGLDYLAFLKIARIIRRDNIDIIHTHNKQPFLDGSIAALLCGGKRLVHTDHARFFPDKVKYMVAEWFLSHFAKKMVGVSEPTTENLHKFEKISYKKLMTIPNGIDETPFVNAKKSEKRAREIGIKKNGVVFGLIARISKPKGIPYLLEAMAKVVKSLPDSTLLLIGEGELEDEMKKISNDFNLSENVIFTGPRTDIPELLKLIDIFVLSSISEGLPMVILEAMAARCPIVSTNVGGIPTVIKDSVNGRIVKPHSAEALADVMLELAVQKDIRERFASAGFELFKQKFSATMMTNAYEKLYID